MKRLDVGGVMGGNLLGRICEGIEHWNEEGSIAGEEGSFDFSITLFLEMI